MNRQKVGGWGKSKRASSHISKLNLPDLPKSADDFPAYFIGDVELGQGHVRRAEEGVLGDRHGEGKGLSFPGRAGLRSLKPTSFRKSRW